ncbi:ATPase [Ignicoccus pacificus DSM 13166]|uniref:ATPase n=1 Tax=Ignicoccus pacificus DSM 13166 TaxID=940294 RepID=A0A977PKH3_9CREN|nr:ATPase [Ignicoccus pacificus DSM 13166]
MEDVAGRVIEIDSLDEYTMVLNTGVRIRKYDYVYHITNGNKVIGYVEDILSRPLLPSELPWSIASKVPIDESTSVSIAKVRVLEGDVPSIGDWVYRASDVDVEHLYSVPPHRRLQIGFLSSRPSVKVSLDINALTRHLAIIAATGSGKTWTTVVLIEELLKKGATVLVLDPHGEYTKLKKKVRELDADAIVLKAHSEQEGDLSYTIDVTNVDSDELAFVMGIPKNASRIRSLLSTSRSIAWDIYNSTGRRDWMSLAGLRRILSYLAEASEVSSSYQQFEAIAKSKSLKVNNNLLKRAWNVLRRNADPAYDLLKYVDELDRLGIYTTRPTPLGAFLRPKTVTVFNLSGIRAEVQTHLVYDILKRTFNARVRYLRDLKGEKYPYPVEVVVEEAHRFAPPPSEGSPWTVSMLKRIASEGRKFGVFLTVITQRPSRVDSTVLSQCQSQIILRIVNPRDQQAVLEASEELGSSLAKDLPSLKPGEALVVGPVIKYPALIKIRDRVLDYGGGDLDLSLEWSKALLVSEEMREYEKLLESLNLESIASEFDIDISSDTLERSKSILISEKRFIEVNPSLKVYFENCSVDIDRGEHNCPDDAYVLAALLELKRRGLLTFQNS